MLALITGFFLVGCGGVQQSAQKGQQNKSSAPPAEEESTPAAVDTGDPDAAPAADPADNPVAAADDSAPASPQIAQAVSSYVVNNNPAIAIDNSTTTIKYNSDNSTAVAAANIEAENTQPTPIFVLLTKGVDGTYVPVRIISKKEAAQLVNQGKQTTIGPDTTGIGPDTTNQTDSCTGASGNTLYQADWSGGLNGWVGPPSWKVVNGQLVNDGSSATGGGWISAPCQPDTANYAVEAQIQLIPPNSCTFVSQQFGVGARADAQGGILGGLLCSNGGLVLASTDTEFSLISNADRIAEKDFTVDGQWHTYRLEVQGNNVRLLVDGTPIVTGTDNRRLDSGEAGLFASELQINVRSFKVTK
jgi:3-keto-disaccharide hydrolase